MKEEIELAIRGNNQGETADVVVLDETAINEVVNDLHKTFIQAQLDTLKDIDKMYHSQDKAHSLRLYIDHYYKLLEDE